MIENGSEFKDSPNFSHLSEDSSMSNKEAQTDRCITGNEPIRQNCNTNFSLTQIQDIMDNNWNLPYPNSFGFGIKEYIESINYLKNFIEANQFEECENDASALSEKYNIIGPLDVYFTYDEFNEFEEKINHIDYHSILKMDPICLAEARELKEKRKRNDDCFIG